MFVLVSTKENSVYYRDLNPDNLLYSGAHFLVKELLIFLDMYFANVLQLIVLIEVIH